MKMFNVGDHIVCKYDGRKGIIKNIYNSSCVSGITYKCLMYYKASAIIKEYYKEEYYSGMAIEIEKEYNRDKKIKLLGI